MPDATSWVQGHDDRHKLQCDCCGRWRYQQHFALTYPRCKGKQTLVKVSSRCKKCRKRIWLRRVYRTRRRAIRRVIDKMNGSFARCNDAQAYVWCSGIIARLGGAGAFIRRCADYAIDTKVSFVARANMHRAIWNVWTRLLDRHDGMDEQAAEDYEKFLEILTPEQRQQEQCRLAKRFLRSLGYIIKRRRPDDLVRSERDTRQALPGVSLVVAPIEHADRLAAGDEIPMDYVLQEVRKQYLQAVARQEGRDVRFHVALTIEENRDTVDYLSREVLPPERASRFVPLDSVPQLSTKPSAR